VDFKGQLSSPVRRARFSGGSNQFNVRRTSNDLEAGGIDSSTITLSGADGAMLAREVRKVRGNPGGTMPVLTETGSMRESIDPPDIGGGPKSSFEGLPPAPSGDIAIAAATTVLSVNDVEEDGVFPTTEERDAIRKPRRSLDL